MLAEPKRADEGLLDSSTTGPAIQDGQETVQANETAESPESRTLEPRTGSAILWDLYSETPTEATNDGSSDFPEADEVTDMNAIINLWKAAGYNCQLASEYTTTSPAVTDMPINDEESSQSDHSQAPLGPYVVRESPGKGQGVFAARDLVKGERILVDAPFFVVTKPYGSRKVLEQFERMPISRRQQYMHLYCPNRMDDVYMTDVMCIFEANCFNIGDRAAVFLTATRFNHSCLPNTYYSWSEKRGEIVLHSMIDLPENDELTICYGPPFCTRLERRSQLRVYDFCCTCPACQPTTLFGHASETRRLAMRALNDQIIECRINPNEALLLDGPQGSLTPVLRLIETIKEEGLHGELMTPYRDAADYLKRQGNFEKALNFAHLELEEEIICLGNDSEVANKTIEYIEELEEAMGEELEIDVDGYLEDIAEAGADMEELEVVSEAESWEETPKNPDEDTDTHEDQQDPNPKEPNIAVPEPDQELKEPSDQKPAAPDQDNHEPESGILGAKTNNESPTDPQSSSPRLARKK